MSPRRRSLLPSRWRARAGWMAPALGALLLGLSPGARAASCTVAAPTFSFPNYSPLDAVPDAGFSTMSVNCALSAGESTASVAYAISLSTGSSGTYTARAFMGQPLEYNLYTTANHTQVWGDGTNNTVTVSGQLSLPGNTNNMHSVYGLIPARQAVEQGTVSDRIVVIVDY